MDTPLFYLLLFTHLSSLILSFGAVLVIDTFGFLWIIRRARMPFIIKVADVTQRLIWIGWILLVISGVGLITLKGHLDALTWIKLFLVGLIGLNGIFLHFIKKTYERLHSARHVPAISLFRIGLATAISQFGWWGALLIGFAHRHISHQISWPISPAPFIVTTLLILICLWLLGELIFGNKKR